MNSRKRKNLSIFIHHKLTVAEYKRKINQTYQIQLRIKFKHNHITQNASSRLKLKNRWHSLTISVILIFNFHEKPPQNIFFKSTSWLTSLDN